jgi:phosphoglycolate phosphatase
MKPYPKTLDSIIFDLDGTLWDTMNACAIAWNRVIQRTHIPFRNILPEDIRKVTGLAHEQCVRRVFQGLPEEKLQILIQETMEEDNRVIAEKGGDLYPGVEDGLFKLKEKYPLFIVSNCQAGYIETFLNWSKFSFFKDFECWGNTGLTKKENLRNLVIRNHLTSSIFIGDTEGDQAAAEACKIPFVHVEYGFGTCVNKDFVVKSFEELTLKLLDSD